MDSFTTLHQAVQKGWTGTPAKDPVTRKCAHGCGRAVTKEDGGMYTCSDCSARISRGRPVKPITDPVTHECIGGCGRSLTSDRSDNVVYYGCTACLKRANRQKPTEGSVTLAQRFGGKRNRVRVKR